MNVNLAKETLSKGEALSSILAICKITEKYKVETPIEQPVVWYNLGSAIPELSQCATPQLQKLINDLQKSFNQEAQILHNNQISQEDIKHVFVNYKEFLLNRYNTYKEYYDDKGKSGYLITPECTYFSKEEYSDSEFKYQTDDFLFELGSVLSLSSMSGTDPINEISNFDCSPLFKSNSYFFGDVPVENKQLQNENFINESSLLFTDEFSVSSNAGNPISPTSAFFEKKKPNFSRECKECLEAIFQVKPFPSTTERKIIASRFKLSPVQVRNWFSNKRARQKIKQFKADKLPLS